MLAIVFCASCSNDESEREITYSRDPMIKTCQRLEVCGVLINGNDANDCVQVQEKKYEDIRTLCDSSTEILNGYAEFWSCMAELSCEEISADVTPCSDIAIATETLLRECGFDV
jgi:hypothetical protein